MLHEKNSADARRWFEEVWNRKSEGIIHEMLAPNIVAHLEPMDVHSIPEFLEQRANREHHARARVQHLSVRRLGTA